MSLPTERPMASSTVTRFFGGPPLSVIFRLVLLSILIGVILEVLAALDGASLARIAAHGYHETGNPSSPAWTLSGGPLFALATRMLAETYVRVEGAFPLVGAGGIDSGEAALAKIRAGACLIQLYSALVFRGLRLVASIRSDLSNALRRDGHAGIDDLVGADAAAMTAEKWPE